MQNNQEEFTTTSSSVFETFHIPRSRKQKIMLDPTFVPNCHTVICGRGKACASSIGNMYLKTVVQSYITPYSQARNKLEKSLIVSNILDSVTQACPKGSFVKYEDGLWWQVDDSVAREKVGCMLRDYLHIKYRSSNKAKLAQRKKARRAARQDIWFPIMNSNKPNQNIGDSVFNKIFDDGSPGTECASMIEPVPLPSVMSFDAQSATLDTMQPQESQNVFSMDNLQEHSDGKMSTRLRFERSSHCSNSLRDLTPMSTHLDIMGSGDSYICNDVDGVMSQCECIFSESYIPTSDTRIETLDLQDCSNNISMVSGNCIYDLSNIFD